MCIELVQHVKHNKFVAHKYPIYAQTKNAFITYSLNVPVCLKFNEVFIILK